MTTSSSGGSSPANPRVKDITLSISAWAESVFEAFRLDSSIFFVKSWPSRSVYENMPLEQAKNTSPGPNEILS